LRNTPQWACIVLRRSLATSGTDSPGRCAREPGKTGETQVRGIRRQRLVRRTLQVLLDDEDARRAAEHDEVGERIRAEPVGAVHRYARAFADRVKAVDDRLVVAVLGATTCP
jgi:hypothetical protein